jgi:hypothetical protein
MDTDSQEKGELSLALSLTYSPTSEHIFLTSLLLMHASSRLHLGRQGTTRWVYIYGYAPSHPPTPSSQCNVVRRTMKCFLLSFPSDRPFSPHYSSIHTHPPTHPPTSLPVVATRCLTQLQRHEVRCGLGSPCNDTGSWRRTCASTTYVPRPATAGQRLRRVRR